MNANLQAEDLSFLRGKEVIQICFGLYQLQLHMVGDVRIYWEHYFEHMGRGARPVDMTENATRDTSLLSLLGQTVERVMVSSDGDLTLQFSNNEVLTLFVDGGMYELVEISAPGKKIIA